MLFVHDSQDLLFPVNQVEELYTAIAGYYQKANQSERLCLQTFENLGHELETGSSNYP
ncbi:MAG: hypothetical protein AAF915_06725 [Cyanobacteria bacterium P01_D01_bin.50]